MGGGAVVAVVVVIVMVVVIWVVVGNRDLIRAGKHLMVGSHDSSQDSINQ